jgi:hypothetical protein
MHQTEREREKNIRLNNNETLVMFVPTFSAGRDEFTSLLNLKTGKTSLSVSYAAFGNHKSLMVH